RAVEAYNPATDSWSTSPPMPSPRHGVAGAVLGNQFHLVSGMISSAGATAFDHDPHLELHTGLHNVLELPGGKTERKSFYLDPKKPYLRYNVNSPEGQKMLAKFELAVRKMKELPDHDPHSWNFQWYIHWIDGPPAHMYPEARKHKTKVIALLPPSSQSL